MCQSLKGFTEFSHLTQVKCSPQNNTKAPIKRRNFSSEFKRVSAHLVVDQHNTVSDATRLWILDFPR